MSASANITNYPTAAVTDMRTTVEQQLEGALGYALVPRYGRRTETPDGGTLLQVRAGLVGEVPNTDIPFVGNVRTASIDGVALSPVDVIPDLLGFYYASGWGTTVRSAVVEYEHGAQYPPGIARREALKLARYYLTASPVDDRATAVTTENMTTSFVTPGRRGEEFPLASTNAFIEAYNLSVGVA